MKTDPTNAAGAVRDGLTADIADDLAFSIANLGFPVGMGISPPPEACLRAAERIVDRIKDRALELLAERAAQ
jgi:hypothetical protein